MTNTSDERSALDNEIEYWLKRWRLGQKAWSLAHHVSLYGAALISVIIGFIVQRRDQTLVESISNETLSTFLALSAAALSALAAAGGFERKWRANRLSRGKLDELRIDFMDRGADLRKARDRLKKIMRQHDQEILGGVPQTAPAESNPSSEQGSVA